MNTVAGPVIEVLKSWLEAMSELNARTVKAIWLRVKCLFAELLPHPDLRIRRVGMLRAIPVAVVVQKVVVRDADR